MQAGTWAMIIMIVGTTIGSGIFGIPFVTVQVGYAWGLFWLLLLGLLTLGMNLMYARVIARTSGQNNLQFVALVGRYLGNRSKHFAGFLTLIGLWGNLLAYIIGIGIFLAVITGWLEGAFFFSILTVIFVAVLMLFQLKVLSAVEGWLVLGMVGIIGLILISGWGLIDSTNLMVEADRVSLFEFLLPYGVFLSALSSSAVLPEVYRIGRESRLSHADYYRSIVVGTLIPLVIYVLFQFVVVGVSGSATSEEAIMGLVPFLDSGIVRLGALFGVLAMLSSFITLAYALRDVFQYDYQIPWIRAWFLTWAPPLVMFVGGLTSFIVVLELTGTWLGTATMVLIVLMYRRVRV